MKTRILTELDFNQESYEKEYKLYRSAKLMKNLFHKVNLPVSENYWAGREEEHHINVIIILSHVHKLKRLL